MNLRSDFLLQYSEFRFGPRQAASLVPVAGNLARCITFEFRNLAPRGERVLMQIWKSLAKTPSRGGSAKGAQPGLSG
jgi:hypothetical protein